MSNEHDVLDEPGGGRLSPWSSKITELTPDGPRTYGIDQRKIIREFSFEQMIFLLLRGRIPSVVEANLLRAVIVSHISHGITGQSTLAVREAADCRSDFLHALIGGFSVGAGVYHQGGLKAAMEELEHFAGLPDDEIEAEVVRRIAEKSRVIGFGHRYYKAGDPRAVELMRLTQENGFEGRHVAVAQKLDTILNNQKGIRMNIEAAGGAILLDLGFPSTIGHLFIILGRSAMFAAAYMERLSQGRPPFQKLRVFDVVRGSAGD